MESPRANVKTTKIFEHGGAVATTIPKIFGLKAGQHIKIYQDDKGKIIIERLVV
jgi:virulence-associated protein VagC